MICPVSTQPASFSSNLSKRMHEVVNIIIYPSLNIGSLIFKSKNCTLINVTGMVEVSLKYLVFTYMNYSRVLLQQALKKFT